MDFSKFPSRHKNYSEDYISEATIDKGLISAAKAGDIQQVELYLAAGASDKACNSALLEAVKNHHYDSVEIICLLIKKGAHLGDEYNTLNEFFLGVMKGDFTLVHKFTVAGLNHQYATDRQGKTALMLAAEHGHADIIQFLYHDGSELNAIAKSHQSYTAMDFAVIRAQNYKDTKGLEMLLQLDAELSCSLTIPNDRMYGKPIDVPFIIWAAYYGFTNVVTLLLSADADNSIIDSVDPTHLQTALIWAVSKGETSIAITLINYGANLDVKSKEGNNLIELAISKRNPELVSYLLNNKYFPADEILLQQSITSGCVEIVAAVLKAIPDVQNNAKVKASSPLYLAVRHDHKNIVSLLLENGFELDHINDLAHEKPGETPLSIAIYNNCIKSLDVLLEAYAKRANDNKQDVDADIERHLNLKGFSERLITAEEDIAFRFLSALPTKRVNQLGDLPGYSSLINKFKEEMKRIRTMILTSLFGLSEEKPKMPEPQPVLPEEKSFIKKCIESFWSVITPMNQALGLATPVADIPSSTETEQVELEIVEPTTPMPQLPKEMIFKVLCQQSTLEVYPFWYQHRVKSDLADVWNSIEKIKGERATSTTVGHIDNPEPELEKKPEKVIFSKFGSTPESVNSTAENELENNPLRKQASPGGGK